MPQSYARVALHAVWATKYRRRVLSAGIRPELHALMAQLVTNNGCTAIEVGGVEDHVHVLFALGRTVTIAKTLECVKTASSKWLKTQGDLWLPFHWQDGYSVFSVWHKDIDIVRAYIRNQEAHHRAESSPQEAIRFAMENGVALDEVNLENEPEPAG
jgi:REP element-mobilizing transposase RayT